MGNSFLWKLLCLSNPKAHGHHVNIICIDYYEYRFIINNCYVKSIWEHCIQLTDRNETSAIYGILFLLVQFLHCTVLLAHCRTSVWRSQMNTTVYETQTLNHRVLRLCWFLKSRRHNKQIISDINI